MVIPLALHNVSLECIIASLINPSYPLFNFTRNTVQLIVYVDPLYCVLYTDLSYVLLFPSELIMSDYYCHCALSILCDTGNVFQVFQSHKQHHPSESMNILHHNICAWFWLSIGFRKGLFAQQSWSRIDRTNFSKSGLKLARHSHWR